MSDEPRSPDTKTVRVRIAGRVQGVWFRGWTAQMAQVLELDGWVRNRRDGTVEALFSGPAEMVDQMLAFCNQGPTHAKVERIDIAAEDDYDGEGFQQLATA